MMGTGLPMDLGAIDQFVLLFTVLFLIVGFLFVSLIISIVKKITPASWRNRINSWFMKTK